MSEGIRKLEQLTRDLAGDPYSIVEELFLTSSALLTILDAEGERFKEVSSSWTSELGWSSEELKNVQFWNFIHPDDIAKTRDAWALALACIPINGFKNRYRTKNGEYVTMVWALPGFKDGVSFSVCHVEKTL